MHKEDNIRPTLPFKGNVLGRFIILSMSCCFKLGGVLIPHKCVIYLHKGTLNLNYIHRLSLTCACLGGWLVQTPQWILLWDIWPFNGTKAQY